MITIKEVTVAAEEIQADQSLQSPAVLLACINVLNARVSALENPPAQKTLPLPPGNPGGYPPVINGL